MFSSPTFFLKDLRRSYFRTLGRLRKLLGESGVLGYLRPERLGNPSARTRLFKLENVWPFWGLQCRMWLLHPPNPLCASWTDLCGADARGGNEDTMPLFVGGIWDSSQGRKLDSTPDSRLRLGCL